MYSCCGLHDVINVCRFLSALDTPNSFPKKLMFELLSCVTMTSQRAHKHVVLALENYKVILYFSLTRLIYVPCRSLIPSHSLVWAITCIVRHYQCSTLLHLSFSLNTNDIFTAYIQSDVIALQTLKHQSYRFSLVMDELRHASNVHYKTTLLCFINALIESEVELLARCRIRDEFIGA